MKKLLLLFLLTPLYVFPQLSFNGAVQYSLKYSAGTSLEAGYYFNNNLYLGVNGRIQLLKRKVDRSMPFFFSGIVGYKINSIEPYLSFGSASTGHEAYIDKEGFKSFTYGGGISYFVSNKFKITLGAIHLKVRQPSTNGQNNYFRHKSIINPFVRFTACFLGKD